MDFELSSKLIFFLNKQETYGRQLSLFLLFAQLTASLESLHLLLEDID